MASQWESGKQYNEGDVVEFEGKRYKIVQQHYSQSDWTPHDTPMLWSCIDVSNEGSKGEAVAGGSDSANESFLDKVKQAYNDHEKEAQIAGGIAAGAAVLGAAGLAYKHHKDNED